MSEFAQYIGLPWREHAAGPDAWDCGTFFAHIQRTHFGVEVLADQDRDYTDGVALALLISGEAEKQGWRHVREPRHGDLVIVHKPRHVGVWIETPTGPGVLHCVKGAGVIFTRFAAWGTSGFGRREYLRRAGGRHAE